MSAVLSSVSGPGRNDASPQGTTVGGSKPLHRFMRGQPKTIGVVVVVLGSSFCIISIASKDVFFNEPLWQGILFLFCGIMYIVTEHNPTKKTVTISLALSIVSILAVFWNNLTILPELGRAHDFKQYEFFYDNITEIEEGVSDHEAVRTSLEGIFIFYSFVGAIIFIVMSTLAGIALRSTKSQAIVMLTAAPTETPAEVTTT